MSDQRTGHKRGRELKTRRSTAFADRLARSVITIGGIGTIVSVCTVFLFLFWVVKDLFLPARVGEPQRLQLPAETRVLAVGIDDFSTIAWRLGQDGRLVVFDARDGTTLNERSVVQEGGPVLTAFGTEPMPGRMVFGYADGSVRPGQLDITTELEKGGLVTVASGMPEHADRRAIRIQNRYAGLHAARLADGETVTLPTAPFVHLFVARGAVDLEAAGALATGDAARITASDGRRVTAVGGPAEVLVWEMHAQLA